MNLLYDSPAATYAERLIGDGKVQNCYVGQIALRFPGDMCVRGGTTMGAMLGASAGEWLPMPGFNQNW
tara:strand:- start:357 stop:560 length:204 start_codon:yes stop_codon:yes gene_type:complete